MQVVPIELEMQDGSLTPKSKNFEEKMDSIFHGHFTMLLTVIAGFILSMIDKALEEKTEKMTKRD